MPTDLIDRLLANPSRHIDYFRYLSKTPPNTKQLKDLQQQVVSSEPVRQLLSERDADGRIPQHPYHKWSGAHWVLASLAELNYPEGDVSLLPLADQVAGFLLGALRLDGLKRRNKGNTTGRYRACASLEGNALIALLKLGLRQDVVPVFAETLLNWQWPDGGWNCDTKLAASHSSFFETLIPMRALNLYGNISGDRKAILAAEQAGEVFLRHGLFKKLSTGDVMDRSFTVLHYPVYWHYDILTGLWAMMELGRLDDPRCQAAKELLIDKRLPDGGFPAEEKFYHQRSSTSNYSTVNWGPAGKTKMNPWVTMRALCVLRCTDF